MVVVRVGRRGRRKVFRDRRRVPDEGYPGCFEVEEGLGSFGEQGGEGSDGSNDRDGFHWPGESFEVGG